MYSSIGNYDRTLKEVMVQVYLFVSKTKKDHISVMLSIFFVLSLIN